MSATEKIVNGPSKFDLMASLFIWKPERQTVTFKPEHGQDYVAVILSVAAEDGSGESWCITGYLRDPIYKAGGKGSELRGGVKMVQNQQFKGYFSTAHRKGWMSFID